MEKYELDKVDGIALYKKGKGRLIFIMPYPHASSGRSVAEGRLSDLIVSAGYSMITFDPPGFGRSEAEAKVNLEEMLNGTEICLDHYGVKNPVPIIGHSMGSFCALAFALESPEKVECLTMVGGTSGWNTVRKYGVHRSFGIFTKDFWLYRYYGTRIILGLDNLAIHKKLDNLNAWYGFRDKTHFEKTEIYPGDRKLPSPVRAKWLNSVRKYNLEGRLGEVNIPVLLITGTHDRITPLPMAKILQQGLANSKLNIFTNSGHSPFIEEPDKFRLIFSQFLEKCEKPG